MLAGHHHSAEAQHDLLPWLPPLALPLFEDRPAALALPWPKFPLLLVEWPLPFRGSRSELLLVFFCIVVKNTVFFLKKTPEP